MSGKPFERRKENRKEFMSKLINLPVATGVPEKDQSQLEWNEPMASLMALHEDMMLSDAHMEVLRYLRHCYARFGRITNTHSLLLALETRFALQGGKQFLQSLFPKGAVTQGCLLAGIPAPLDFVMGMEIKNGALTGKAPFI
jgi:tRNA 2-thiouridine synthesizing protein E